MATKNLEVTIHFIHGIKRLGLIRPKITVWKCFGNSRNRVHKTKAASYHLAWRETVRVEYPMPDATLVFQLTDIFHRNLGQATVPMTDVTECGNKPFPLVSSGQTLGSLILTLRVIDRTNHDQSTTTNKRATNKLEVADQICSIVDDVIEVARGCASLLD